MPPEDERIFGFERAEDSPGFLLWQVHSVWHRRVNAALRPLGLTHAQFVLLASLTWLTDHGTADAITQADLAGHARMDVMLTSDVVRTLAAKDLLERRPHPRDARARALVVTPAGRELAGRSVGGRRIGRPGLLRPTGRRGARPAAAAPDPGRGASLTAERPIARSPRSPATRDTPR